MKKYATEILSFVLLAAGLVMRSSCPDVFRAEWVEMVYFLAAFLPVGIPVLREAAEYILK